MDTTNTQTETRQVSGFERVSIRGLTCSAQIIITQSEREGLTIEAPPEYLHRLRSEVKNGKLTIRLAGSWLQELEDALTNWLNKPPILYRLDVRELTYLEVQCAYSVHAPRIETPHLHVKLNGDGDLRLDWLSAEKLEVHHSGTGILRISGQVEEQSVVLNGAGSYMAPRLDSQRARVHMRGVGSASMHVNQLLDATMRGVGILEYSGRADVHKRISGPGQILHIGKVREEVAA
jgi:hypothetical protein